MKHERVGRRDLLWGLLGANLKGNTVPVACLSMLWGILVVQVVEPYAHSLASPRVTMRNLCCSRSKNEGRPSEF